MADYFYSRDDQKFGPFTAQKIKELAAQGHISREDTLWTEGWDAWRPAGGVRGVFAEPAAAPAPIALPPGFSAPAGQRKAPAAPQTPHATAQAPTSAARPQAPATPPAPEERKPGEIVRAAAAELGTAFLRKLKGGVASKVNSPQPAADPEHRKRADAVKQAVVEVGTALLIRLRTKFASLSLSVRLLIGATALCLFLELLLGLVGAIRGHNIGGSQSVTNESAGQPPASESAGQRPASANESTSTPANPVQNAFLGDMFGSLNDPHKDPPPIIEAKKAGREVWCLVGWDLHKDSESRDLYAIFWNDKLESVVRVAKAKSDSAALWSSWHADKTIQGPPGTLVMSVAWRGRKDGVGFTITHELVTQIFTGTTDLFSTRTETSEITGGPQGWTETKTFRLQMDGKMTKDWAQAVSRNPSEYHVSDDGRTWTLDKTTYGEGARGGVTRVD